MHTPAFRGGPDGFMLENLVNSSGRNIGLLPKAVNKSPLLGCRISLVLTNGCRLDYQEHSLL